MNLEQLIFTWNGRHLVLALFASIQVKQAIKLNFSNLNKVNFH